MHTLSPFVRAVAQTILTFAVFHLGYLLVAAIWLKQWHLISLFSILDFQMIWPGIEYGARNAAVGMLVIAAIFYINYRSVARGHASS